MARCCQQPDDQMARRELKDLLQDILNAIDRTPKDERQRLLGSLRDWQRGDRREHPRKNCSIPVKLESSRAFTEHIRNISVGGVFIKTAAPFSRGEQLTMIFSLPDQNSPVRIVGNVAWRSPEGVGVEFMEPLSPEMKDMIDSL